MKKVSTKEKILSAARKVFIDQGFAGASISQIADLAEINHSLIFHHFGNKEQLWIAVKQDIVQEASQKSKTIPSKTLLFKDFLKELFHQNIIFYRNNPDIVSMINWQRSEYKASKSIGITHSKDMQILIDAFKHYQQHGDINPRLKPEFIITLVFSIISSMALDPNIFISDESDQQEYVNFCLECLEKALSI